VSGEERDRIGCFTLRAWPAGSLQPSSRGVSFARSLLSGRKGCIQLLSRQPAAPAAPAAPAGVHATNVWMDSTCTSTRARTHVRTRKHVHVPGTHQCGILDVATPLVVRMFLTTTQASNSNRSSPGRTCTRTCAVWQYVPLGIAVLQSTTCSPTHPPQLCYPFAINPRRQPVHHWAAAPTTHPAQDEMVAGRIRMLSCNTHCIQSAS
jgi:hypothetical protein